MKKLRDIMRHGFLFTVQRGAMVAEAVRTMAANNVGIVACSTTTGSSGSFPSATLSRKSSTAGSTRLARRSLR